ncbi:MAG: hypothetical protein AAF208_13555 [Cyanobacteria bacterium P01_A01_bin.45]
MARKSTTNTPKTTTKTATANNSSISKNIKTDLSIPKFEANSHMATDLFSVSSSLPRTTKTKADESIQAIEEQRQTVRVAKANIQLNRDVTQAATEYKGLEADVIKYATQTQKVETEGYKYQQAVTDTNIQIEKLSQLEERLQQEKIATDGTKKLTPHIREQWEQREQLEVSKTEALKTQVLQADQKLNEQLDKLKF